MFGQKSPKQKQIGGIPIRKHAKYLGVTYNQTLSVKVSLAAFDQKIKWTQAKLYRVLKAADFRTRFNLWQILVCPLYRMVLSVVG